MNRVSRAMNRGIMLFSSGRCRSKPLQTIQPLPAIQPLPTMPTMPIPPDSTINSNSIVGRHPSRSHGSFTAAQHIHVPRIQQTQLGGSGIRNGIRNGNGSGDWNLPRTSQDSRSCFSLTLFRHFGSTLTSSSSLSSSSSSSSAFASVSASASVSVSASASDRHRPDPFARRPTAKCDPYGQGGKPLTLGEAKRLLMTVEPEWEILSRDDGGEEETNNTNTNNNNTNTITTNNNVTNNSNITNNNTNNNNNHDNNSSIPFAIARTFWHDEYPDGAEFVTHVAAVAQIHAQRHFPHEVLLDRTLDSRTKTWRVRTRVVCRTHVLQGLSHHDFYLATLLDIEVQRPEVNRLVAVGAEAAMGAEATKE